MSDKPKVEVEESADYVNCLDLLDDNYVPPEATTFGSIFEEAQSESAVKLEKPASSKDDSYKTVRFHFRNESDLDEFARMIDQRITPDTKRLYHPKPESNGGLFEIIEKSGYFDVVVKPAKKSKKRKVVETELVEVEKDTNKNIDKWRNHWTGMPEFTQEENGPWKTIPVTFATEEDMADFADLIGQSLTDKTKSTWHPRREITKNYLMRWVEEDADGNRVYTQPEYPLYIISKNRHESMFTSRSLSRMRIKHYIAIEPQDWDNYEQALDNFGIRDYVTLLLLPFSNHGDGPGRARNWCWDHSKDVLGAKRHWVFDDNIQDFYRLHENERIRVESGVMFKVMEDFCDRYENVPLAGLQYRFFCAADQSYPGYVKNTRIYSALLIENECRHRWRGRYNEDTDLSLNVLKDGDATVQFNIFLQGKCATQTVKGGNSTEFYHKEGVEEEMTEEEIAEKVRKEGTRYNVNGTVNKSLMLERMHPDVAQMVWKYGRWHHHVDYSPFKDIMLRLKPGVEVPKGIDNYGLVKKVYSSAEEVDADLGFASSEDDSDIQQN